jgi:hypothetical protein
VIYPGKMQQIWIYLFFSSLAFANDSSSAVCSKLFNKVQAAKLKAADFNAENIYDILGAEVKFSVEEVLPGSRRMIPVEGRVTAAEYFPNINGGSPGIAFTVMDSTGARTTHEYLSRSPALSMVAASSKEFLDYRNRLSVDGFELLKKGVSPPRSSLRAFLERRKNAQFRLLYLGDPKAQNGSRPLMEVNTGKLELKAIDPMEDMLGTGKIEFVIGIDGGKSIEVPNSDVLAIGFR